MLQSFRQPQRAGSFVHFQRRTAKSNRRRRQRSSVPRLPTDELSDSAASASCHSLAIASSQFLYPTFGGGFGRSSGPISRGLIAAALDHPVTPSSNLFELLQRTNVIGPWQVGIELGPCCPRNLADIHVAS